MIFPKEELGSKMEKHTRLREERNKCIAISYRPTRKYQMLNKISDVEPE